MARSRCYDGLSRRRRGAVLCGSSLLSGGVWMQTNRGSYLCHGLLQCRPRSTPDEHFRYDDRSVSLPCVQYEGWAPRGRACNVCVCSHVCVARSFVRLSVTRHRAGYLSLQSEFRPGFVFESSRRERRTIAPTRKGDPPVRVLLLLILRSFFFYSSILVR